MEQAHVYTLNIYYEDTDITGLVYHPNYFKYFERARSDFFGGQRLYQMQQESKISVAVYKAEIVFKKGAVLGDSLEIHSQARIQGKYRVIFEQLAFRPADQSLLVEAKVELVCIFDKRAAPIPDWIIRRVEQSPGQ